MEMSMMIPQLAFLYLLGLPLFIICQMASKKYHKDFKQTGLQPFRYGGYDNKYPQWLTVTSFVSIALLVVGSSGLVLLFLAIPAYEAITDPDG